MARGSGLAALTIDTLMIPDKCTNYIEPTSLASELLQEGTVAIDVRTAEERTDGYIAGSLHIPATEWDALKPTSSIMALHPTLEYATHLIFYCMYSRERGPRAATAATWAQPGLRVSILRGGFQQCMAQLWDGDCDRSILAGVQQDRWVPNGSQGLVWANDMLFSAAGSAVLEARLKEEDGK